MSGERLGRIIAVAAGVATVGTPTVDHLAHAAQQPQGIVRHGEFGQGYQGPRFIVPGTETQQSHLVIVRDQRAISHPEQFGGGEQEVHQFVNAREIQDTLTTIFRQYPRATQFDRDQRERLAEDYLNRIYDANPGLGREISPSQGLPPAGWIIWGVENIIPGGAGVYNSRTKQFSGIPNFDTGGVTPEQRKRLFYAYVTDEREFMFADGPGRALPFSAPFEPNPALRDNVDLGNDMERIIRAHVGPNGVYDIRGAIATMINHFNFIYDSRGGQQAGAGVSFNTTEPNAVNALHAGIWIAYGNFNPEGLVTGGDEDRFDSPTNRIAPVTRRVPELYIHRGGAGVLVFAIPSGFEVPIPPHIRGRGILARKVQ